MDYFFYGYPLLYFDNLMSDYKLYVRKDLKEKNIKIRKSDQAFLKKLFVWNCRLKGFRHRREGNYFIFLN